MNPTSNKATVTKYMNAFNETDHEMILALLTDDVEWIMPGAYHHKGKAAFDKEIENDAFEGKPVIKITRLTEENNVVVAEGTVVATKKGGEKMPLAFCDVFELHHGKIKKLISYIMPTSVSFMDQL